MKSYLVYKLVRSDGKAYIGTTNTDRLTKRLAQHRCSARFKNFTFTCEILLSDESADVLNAEAQLIIEHNTLEPHGLNKTWSGKGNGHNSPSFTTQGYCYSDESRQRMSESAKRRCREHPRVGWRHSEDTKRAWSLKRRGIIARETKGKKLSDVCQKPEL